MRKHISYAEGTKTSHESRLGRRVFAFLSAVNLSIFIKYGDVDFFNLFHRTFW